MPACAPPSAPHPPANRARRLARAGWVFGALLLLAVLGVGLHLGELHEVAALLAALRWPWLAAALALQAVTYVFAAGAWQRVLARLGSSRRLASLVPLSLAKLFTDQAMPSGGLSGNILFVHAMRRRGIRAPAAMAALAASMIGHYLAMLLLALVAGAALARHGVLHAALLALLCVYGLFAVILAGAVWALASGRGLPHWLPLRRIPGAQRLQQALAHTAPNVLRGPVLAPVTTLHAGIVLCDAATLWVMLWALGQAPVAVLVLAAFVCASLVMEIGPIPLGLGSFEATCVTVLGLAGVPVAAALPATLLLRSFTVWLPMLPGLWLTRRELRRAPAAP